MTKEQIMEIVREVIKNELDVEVDIETGSGGFVEVTTRVSVGEECIYHCSNYDYIRID